MKSSNSNTYRRKFLGVLAAGAASVGATAVAFAGTTDNGLSAGNVRDGNVMGYGTKGDGKTDDTRAIQATVDAAVGAVYFPKGIFRITKTIEINLDKVGYTSVTSSDNTNIAT